MMSLLGVTLGITVLAWYKKIPYVLLLLALVVGFCWGDINTKKIAAFPGEVGDILSLTGKVVSTPSEMTKGYKFYLEGSVVADNGAKSKETYRILIYGNPESQKLVYGDMVQVEGKVLAGQYFGNPGSFNYSEYLASQEVSATVDSRYQGEIFRTGHRSGWGFMELAEHTKNKVYAAIDRIPEESKGFLTGIIFGDKSNLSAVEKSMLSAVGIFHAFAVSGLHVGFVALFMAAMAEVLRLKPWGKLIFVSVGLLFYGAMAGFTPSVTRAVIMSMMIYLAYAIGTGRDSFTALGVAAAIILFFSPTAVTTAGFQLSFAATWGILYLTPVFDQLLPGKKGKIKSSLAVTFAAQFATMPLIAYYYSLLTVGGMLLSPLVIPLVGLVVLLGIVACLFSFLSVVWATVPLYAAGLIADGIYLLSALFEKLPFAYFTVAKPPVWLMCLFYLILISIPFWGKRESFRGGNGMGELLDGLLAERKLSEETIAPIEANKPNEAKPRVNGYRWVGLLMLVGMLFLPNVSWGHRLEVVFLDVGQGSSALMVTPEKKYILIDGGDQVSGDDYLGERVVLPYLKQRGITTLDAVVNTHPHSDHTAAIKGALAYLDVKLFITSEAFPDVEEQQLLLSLAAERDIPISFVRQGQRITLEPGLTMEVFYPVAGEHYPEDDANNGSLVLKLTYGDVDILLTGDNENPSLAEITDFPLQSEILLLPHHGSRGSLHEEFYQQVAPEVVIASAGRGNKFGHPSKDVVNYWQDKHIPLYRTDIDGAITVKTNGKTYTIDTFFTRE
ncbi:MAG: ComEC/Rec2 family competence protein [Peptococcaceae bacterium]|nr:ComEC/Rec2 family competence protein [Peptococcaceae bacterium]